MKTVITTLPIYDNISKQLFQRSAHAGMDRPRPISCPLDEIPAFQWNDNGDGCTSVSTIDLCDPDGGSTDITAYFGALPAQVALTSVTYFIYEGGALSTPIPCGVHYLKITMDNGEIYYSEYFDAEDVSEGYVQWDISNVCDLGDIIYQTGFIQSAWFKAEPMEPSFPIEEELIANGEGRPIRVFARQTKQYSLKTTDMPDYMVEVFNRAKLHDTLQITDLVGDSHDVLNLEVAHDWLNDDRYYAQINLTFDYNEVFVVGGCCNNIV